MRRRGYILVSAAAALFWLAPRANSQASPFAVRVQYGSTVVSYTEGTTVTVPAEAIGVPATVFVTLTYRGATTADVTAVDLSGYTDFSLLAVPNLPATVRPNGDFTVTLRYTPSSGASVRAQVQFAYTEAQARARITLSLNGVAPEFAFSYTPPGGNATLVEPGGTVTFPATAVDTTASASFVVTNRGSGPGVIGAVAVAGAVFQLVGAPLPNTVIESLKDARFSVAFTPKQLEASQGALSVTVGGRQVSFNLAGSGSGPVFAYETVREGLATAITPAQVITVPDAAIGDKSTLAVRVRNGGNADGAIAAISILGTGFQLSDLPFLPLTLPVGGAVQFTIAFTPTQPGWASGRLKIGADTFDVRGAGLGATLTYAYSVGDVTTAIQSGGSVILAPVQVGRTATARFYVINNGTAPGAVNSISVTGTTTAFTLADLPSLPLSVSAGATAFFTIQFTPTVVGGTTATLRVDTLSFTLSGTAAAPDPLPSYRFEAPSGSQEPMQQPQIALTLAAPYPLPLIGTLTLAFNSEVFSNDPAVQFAIGGRTVSFTIPANTTKAVFPQNLTTIRVQTGTVAGTISITPTFATDKGIDLTPANPTALNLVVPQSAPRLLGVEVSAKTTSTFTLLLRGYATSRSVTQMDFQFTPTTGENVATTRLTLNVEANFLSWYQQSQSQLYGSLFTATIPFTVQGDVKNVTSVADTIQSVLVTLSSRQGSSAAQSVSLR